MKYVLITRTVQENAILKEKLEKKGLKVFSFPSIVLEENPLDIQSEYSLRHLQAFDWIIFTSKAGVQFFFIKINKTEIPNIVKIAAVGQKTAEEITRVGLAVHFIPSKYTNETLAREIPDVRNKKLLLPRSNRSSNELINALEKRGGVVTDIPVYKTVYANTDDTELLTLFKKNEISVITFTSPSTVTGFLRNITDTGIREKMKHIHVIAIGPVTAEMARKVGYTDVTIANPHTTSGIIHLLKSTS